MQHIKFTLDIAEEDALTCYALLARLVKKIEPFYTDQKDLLSLEVKMYTNEEDPHEKIAVFTVITTQGKIIEPGKGIQGCEMHELNGWGSEYQIVKPKRHKRKLLTTWLESIHNFFQRPDAKDDQT